MVFLVERNPKDVFQWLEEPLLPYLPGELNNKVDYSICITSGGAIGLYWRDPGVPGNPG